jgi:hypothetical protein
MRLHIISAVWAICFSTSCPAISSARRYLFTSIYRSIGCTSAFRSKTALGVRLYALVIFRRHSFWTLCRGLAVVVASGSPLVRILHSCDPYRRVSLTTAVYKSRKFRADGPHVEVAILARALEAASPLRVVCVICSFQVKPESSHTPRTLIALSCTSTLWLPICTVDARSSRA